jgi:hypothetical protein
MTRLIWDIESNGLAPTKVWCIVTEDIDSGVILTYVEGQWQLFNASIAEATEVI